MSTTLTPAENSHLKVVVRNSNPDVFEVRNGVRVFRGRLSKMADFLARHTVISNGPFLPRNERMALALADQVEARYKAQVKDHPFESEQRIYLARQPAAELRDGAVKILRERNYNVTYSEIATSGTARFTLSRKPTVHTGRR